jgi:hypothetical protein
VKALAMAKGNLPGALAIAQNNKEWMDTSPEVAKVLMAAVAGGDTTTAGWASELVYNQNLANEFIEFLRPARRSRPRSRAHARAVQRARVRARPAARRRTGSGRASRCR